MNEMRHEEIKERSKRNGHRKTYVNCQGNNGQLGTPSADPYHLLLIIIISVDEQQKAGGRTITIVSSKI
jgi:hypothetical protein